MPKFGNQESNIGDFTIGILHIVPLPIGNYEDITLRGLSVLKESDFIICEEYKEANRILSHFIIKKELIALNEHNERDEAPEIISRLKSGQKAALISDCGTPLFSDPGHYLLDLCLQAEINVVVLPGASSLMPALSGSNLHAEKFYYYGWLSPKKELRKNELLRLKKIREIIVILDTPYRLAALLRDCEQIFGAGQKVVLAFDISKSSEKFYRMTIGELITIQQQSTLKGEFVFLIDNRKE